MQISNSHKHTVEANTCHHTFTTYKHSSCSFIKYYGYKDLSTIILIFRKDCPATSYVAATFHPTIGQCDHQSLSSNATPELGMISARNKEH